MFLLVYLLAMVNNPKARKMCMIYTVHLGTSVVMTFVAGIVNETRAFVACGAIAILSEGMMYITELLYLPRKDIMPIDVEHKIERTELWAILVVGEAMLSLMHGAGAYYDPESGEYYINSILGFSIMFILMKLYDDSSPHEHSEIDNHA